jgi:hypothetical protein
MWKEAVVARLRQCFVVGVDDMATPVSVASLMAAETPAVNTEILPVPPCREISLFLLWL